MNLETQRASKSLPVIDMEMEDFDFKPITSGLGFHQQKVSEVKPAFIETPIAKVPERKVVAARESAQLYQNDLSLFYGQTTSHPSIKTSVTAPEMKTRKTKIYRVASGAERVTAYLIDLSVVVSLLGVMMTAMARSMEMDLMQAWGQYPNEITPLVVTLFCGFYLIYFSIFEKASSSTLGKNIFNLKVLDLDEKSVSFSALLVRSVVTLTNYVSLGLFSYFNLQNKITHTKVVKG
jgi:uncharacterized RDD family membrane protein YckC